MQTTVTRNTRQLPLQKKIIDEDISEEEIVETTEYKVLNVRRLNKTNRDSDIIQENDPKRVLRRSMIIFSDQSLPSEIEIHKGKVKVLYQLCVSIVLNQVTQVQRRGG